MKQPILVIGMHRSGTTIVVQILQSLGFFPGVKVEENRESVFFQDLNRWILRSVGGRWDHPEPIDHLLGQNEQRRLAVDYLREQVRFPNMARYWGIRRLPGVLIRQLHPSLWGWKDPRTTVTLPLWLEIYPDARVIYITRHGVDVAASLVRRERAKLQHAVGRFDRLRPLYRVYAKTGARDAGSIRSSQMEGAFDLWTAYLERAEQNLNAVPENRIFRLQYEGLLGGAGGRIIKALTEFIGAEDRSTALTDVTLDVRRVYAYRQDPALLSFAAAHRDLLSRFGYDDV